VEQQWRTHCASGAPPECQGAREAPIAPSPVSCALACGGAAEACRRTAIGCVRGALGTSGLAAPRRGGGLTSVAARHKSEYRQQDGSTAGLPKTNGSAPRRRSIHRRGRNLACVRPPHTYKNGRRRDGGVATTAPSRWRCTAATSRKASGPLPALCLNGTNVKSGSRSLGRPQRLPKAGGPRRHSDHARDGRDQIIPDRVRSGRAPAPRPPRCPQRPPPPR
jgi:hypothetical protein